jgi:hypothetical protein
MTDQERAVLNTLGKRIVEEKDPRRFDELVVELNELLEKKPWTVKPKAN